MNRNYGISLVLVLQRSWLDRAGCPGDDPQARVPPLFSLVVFHGDFSCVRAIFLVCATGVYMLYVLISANNFRSSRHL